MGMKIEMERSDAEGFVADFNRAYDEETEVKRIFGHRFYGSTEKGNEDGNEVASVEEGLRYFQIGRRTALPVSLVAEGRYAYVSDTVVRELCEGEKTFLAEMLSLAADDGEIPTVGEEPVRTVEAALEHVEEPDHLLLPRNDEYDEAVARWEAKGRLRRFGDSSYLTGPDEDDEGAETDCWLYRYDPTPETRGAFVLGDAGVTVVQKRGGDAAAPAGFGYVEEYGDLNDGESLTVYFGRETREGEGEGRYDEFLDVVYRVVLSEPVVGDGGVCGVLCP